MNYCFHLASLWSSKYARESAFTIRRMLRAREMALAHFLANLFDAVRIAEPTAAYCLTKRGADRLTAEHVVS